MRAEIKLTTLAVAILAVCEHEFRSYQAVQETAELGRGNSFAPAAAEASSTAGDRSAEVGAVLGRPLFQPNRRPAPEAAAPKLGRLEGIIVSETEKRLIFAGSSGGKPVMVKEGDQIDADVVQSISEDHAALLGPGGVRIITPSFDAGGTSGVHPAQADAIEKKATAEPQSRMYRRQ